MCPLIKRPGLALFQNMRPNLWSTRLSFWGFKRKPKVRPRVWKAQLSVWKDRPRVCVIITQPILSQSAKVGRSWSCIHVFLYVFWRWYNIFFRVWWNDSINAILICYPNILSREIILLSQKLITRCK